MKSNLRRFVFEKRKQLDATKITEASQKVAEQIIALPVFLNAQNIGYYSAKDCELDPIYIAQAARLLKKNLFLPVISDQSKKRMVFYSHTETTPLIENQWHILEPNVVVEKPIEAYQLDIIFIPILGFDDAGNRLGRGAGFYDRYLACLKNTGKLILIGLAYEFQKLAHVPTDDWDVPMDMIVTEKNIYKNRTSNY